MFATHGYSDGSKERIQDLKNQVKHLKEIEARLLHRQKSLKEAERLAKLGHWELEVGSNVLTWSDEIFRIFEINPDQFGATYEAFLATIHPEDRDMVNDAYLGSLENQTPYSITHRLLLNDGRIKFVTEHCMTNFDTDGNPLRSMGTVHDITDRVQRQEELLKAQKLKAIGTIAGGIAHDFNNLLMGVLGNLELALEKTRDDQELYSLVEKSRNAALRARDISGQLLTFSKGGDPVCMAIDTGNLIREVADFFRSGSPIMIDYQIPDSLWFANADPGQVSQVLQNLVLNAMEAMKDGGKIFLECHNRLVTINDKLPIPSGRFVEIKIRDTGPGMTREIADMVFEPYFTTKDNGNGLGLSIVHSIVQKHDGHISLTTIPGQGTTFSIFLPAKQQAIPTSYDSPKTPTQALTILIVDDDPAVGDVSSRMATQLGHKCLHVTSSREAVDSYRIAFHSDKPFDLVILDLTLPGDKGGLWIMKELQGLDPAVRALISSGYSYGETMSKYAEYGFVGVLKKPFSSGEMKEALDSVSP